MNTISKNIFILWCLSCIINYDKFCGFCFSISMTCFRNPYFCVSGVGFARILIENRVISFDTEVKVSIWIQHQFVFWRQIWCQSYVLYITQIFTVVIPLLCQKIILTSMVLKGQQVEIVWVVFMQKSAFISKYNIWLNIDARHGVSVMCFNLDSDEHKYFKFKIPLLHHKLWQLLWICLSIISTCFRNSYLCASGVGFDFKVL